MTRPLLTHGGDRRRAKPQVPPLNRGRLYIVARLQRDGHADLVTAIQNGQISANAVAIQMGYRKPKRKS